MKKKATKPKAIAADDVDDDFAEVDAEDPEDGTQVSLGDTVLVSKFIRMLPRAVFDTPEIEGQKRSIASCIKELKDPGVYILYRDDVPFYVGKTEGRLLDRLWQHANGVSSNRSYFWNYFSAFIVKKPSHIAEVEAILILAMPSVITNSARPTLPKVPKGISTVKLIRELRKKTWRY